MRQGIQRHRMQSRFASCHVLRCRGAPPRDCRHHAATLNMARGYGTSTCLDPLPRRDERLPVLSSTLIALGFALVVLVSLWSARRWADRAAVRVVHRFGARV